MFFSTTTVKELLHDVPQNVNASKLVLKNNFDFGHSNGISYHMVEVESSRCHFDYHIY